MSSKSAAQDDLSFIPPDALNPELKPTGHKDVDEARDALQGAIDFLKDVNSASADPLHFFRKKDQEDQLDENKKYRYEKNGCKTHISQYWRDQGTTQYKWWSEVLLAVRANITDADAEHEFALLVDFHGGGFVSTA
jgi:hypothetical protein